MGAIQRILAYVGDRGRQVASVVADGVVSELRALDPESHGRRRIVGATGCPADELVCLRSSGPRVRPGRGHAVAAHEVD